MGRFWGIATFLILAATGSAFADDPSNDTDLKLKQIGPLKEYKSDAVAPLKDVGPLKPVDPIKPIGIDPVVPKESRVPAQSEDKNSKLKNLKSTVPTEFIDVKPIKSEPKPESADDGHNRGVDSTATIQAEDAPAGDAGGTALFTAPDMTGLNNTVAYSPEKASEKNNAPPGMFQNMVNDKVNQQNAKKNFPAGSGGSSAGC